MVDVRNDAEIANLARVGAGRFESGQCAWRQGIPLGSKNFGNARAEGGARVSLFSHSQTLSGGLSLAIKLLTKLAQGVSKSYAY